jgi:hypothetical protein
LFESAFAGDCFDYLAHGPLVLAADTVFSHGTSATLLAAHVPTLLDGPRDWRAIERATELLRSICGGQAGPLTVAERVLFGGENVHGADVQVATQAAVEPTMDGIDELLFERLGGQPELPARGQVAGSAAQLVPE